MRRIVHWKPTGHYGKGIDGADSRYRRRDQADSKDLHIRDANESGFSSSMMKGIPILSIDETV
jgi:hypothetical protein